jgi:hypothetical protein
MKQLVILPFLMFFVSCYVSPSPIYKLNPISDNTFWLFGQEYTKSTHKDVEIAFAFERMIDGNLIFDIEITNISDQTILISPENFYYYPMQSIEDSISNQNNKIFAIDPEMKLHEIDSKISTETARYKSSSDTDDAISLLDLMSDISTIGKKKTEEEVEKENKEDSDREDNKNVRDENYRNRMYDLNILRDEWELSTIRKTTLMPNTFIQGRVYFPFRTNTKYIKIYFPLEDDLSTFVFLVEKQSP